MQQPLMNKAVAVWLIGNTSLTFKQIADFCSLHELQVQLIADGESNKTLRGVNPIITGETTEEEIRRCEKDSNAVLRYFVSEEYEKFKDTSKKSGKSSKIKHKNKLDGIVWVINHYPAVDDIELSKLFSTTVNTVKSIRSKSHWNYKNLISKNPVTLGLCSEEELHNLVLNNTD